MGLLNHAAFINSNHEPLFHTLLDMESRGTKTTKLLVVPVLIWAWYGLIGSHVILIVHFHYQQIKVRCRQLALQSYDTRCAGGNWVNYYRNTNEHSGHYMKSTTDSPHLYRKTINKTWTWINRSESQFKFWTGLIPMNCHLDNTYFR